MAEPATRIPSAGPGTRTARERLRAALVALVTAAIALLLLLGAGLGIVFTLGGRSLPRTLRETSRVAVLGGSLVGRALGLALVIAGPPR